MLAEKCRDMLLLVLCHDMRVLLSFDTKGVFLL